MEFDDDFEDDEFCGLPLSEEEITIQKSKKKEELWHLANIGVIEGWKFIRDALSDASEDAVEISQGKGSTAVIINSGADYNHDEIKGRFTDFKGKNLIDNTEKPMDIYGHGTNVASVIAGNAMGVAPQCTLYSLKIGQKEEFSTLKLKEALRWCIKNKDKYGLDLINLSLSKAIYDEELESLCSKIDENGIIMVAAASNKGCGAFLPAIFDNVISVAAIDRNNRHCKFSNVWPTTDISAPGDYIFAASVKDSAENDYKNAYVLARGTSIAAPIISGVLSLAVAYLKFKKKGYSPEQLKQLLKKSATPAVKEDKQHIDDIIANYRLNRLNPNIDQKEFIRWMYGAGVVRADRFLQEVVRFYSK